MKSGSYYIVLHFFQNRNLISNLQEKGVPTWNICILLHIQIVSKNSPSYYYKAAPLLASKRDESADTELPVWKRKKREEEEEKGPVSKTGKEIPAVVSFSYLSSKQFFRQWKRDAM